MSGTGKVVVDTADVIGSSRMSLEMQVDVELTGTWKVRLGCALVRLGCWVMNLQAVGFTTGRRREVLTLSDRDVSAMAQWPIGNSFPEAMPDLYQGNERENSRRFLMQRVGMNEREVKDHMVRRGILERLTARP